MPEETGKVPPAVRKTTTVGTPGGRYLISLDAVDAGGAVTVHDMEGGTDERCNLDSIQRRSRFNSLEWATQKGYRLCAFCFPEVEA